MRLPTSSEMTVASTPTTMEEYFPRFTKSTVSTCLRGDWTDSQRKGPDLAEYSCSASHDPATPVGHREAAYNMQLDHAAGFANVMRPGLPECAAFHRCRIPLGTPHKWKIHLSGEQP